jgi:hypothetical protein
MYLGRAVFILVFWLVGVNLCFSQDSTFRTVFSSSDEVVFQYHPRAYKQSIRFVEGEKFVAFSSIASGATSEEGKPQLPEDGTLFGVPPNSSVSVEILESKFDVQTSDPVLPASSYTVDTNHEAIAHAVKDAQFYEGHSGFYPVEVVRVVQLAQIRDQRVAKIIVHPIQYNPATRQLKRLTHLKVRCRFLSMAKATTGASHPAGADPQFEPVYKGLVANYSQAKDYRFRPAAVKELSAVDSTVWFVPGRTYYRLPVGQDGLYRLTFGQLDSAGLDLRSVNTNALGLYAGGKPVPMLVNTAAPDPQAWYIDFYARRNYGQNSYYDLYSDTNYYWLATDDNDPRRFQSVPPINGIPLRQPSSYLRTLHFEQDLKYYFGYNDDEIANTNMVSGEGWYWTDFFPATIWTYSFTIDSVVKLSGGTAVVRARLFGMTKTATPSQHTAQVQLNGTTVGQISWTDNTEADFTATVADTVLRSGVNTLKVTSLTTSSPVNKFYLDWFEIDHN